MGSRPAWARVKPYLKRHQRAQGEAGFGDWHLAEAGGQLPVGIYRGVSHRLKRTKVGLGRSSEKELLVEEAAQGLEYEPQPVNPGLSLRRKETAVSLAPLLSSRHPVPENREGSDSGRNLTRPRPSTQMHSG